MIDFDYPQTFHTKWVAPVPNSPRGNEEGLRSPNLTTPVCETSRNWAFEINRKYWICSSGISLFGKHSHIFNGIVHHCPFETRHYILRTRNYLV